MIEPNRLSAPGERAALERVEEIAAQIDGLSLERFVPARVHLLDADEHARLVAEVAAEADRCGRRALLDEVCLRVRDAIRTRANEPLRIDPIGRYPLSPTGAEDAALIEMTVVDAVAVAVMEDRIPEETAALLSAPGRALLGLPPLAGERLSSSGAPPVPEPSAEDWAEAASGDAQVAGPSPILMTARIVVAIAIACTFGPAALIAGVAVGQTGAGVLAGLAVVAVCWLLATYRR